jgi:thymidylate kinase
MINELIDIHGKKDINTLTNGKHELGLIRDLCEALEQKRINYCHWKSNNAIERSASGENDLDLLVSRSDIQQFTGILTQLGFVQAEAYLQYQVPGILDYYGYDHETGALVHAHVHYQLVLGHDATKNYHIPIEEQYLASASQTGLFRIPSAEFELIILVIRLVLKHCTWDALLLSQGKLSPSEQNELDDLLRRTSETGIFEILNKHLPNIGSQVYANCIKVLTSHSSLFERALIGQKLVNCLKPFGRYPPIVDSGLKLWRRFAWPFEIRFLRRDDRKRMNSGGLMVAFIGGDGAGKTTAVESVYQWLSSDFGVKRFHMGKPKWSFLTVLIRGILKIGRSLGFYPFMRADILYTNDANLLVFPGYPWLIRETCTARDRYLTYLRARRLTANGKLVILDRFPLSQIKFMDGPQGIRLTANFPQTRLVKFLINLEESYYKKISLPDLLILLRVDPATAVQRKTDEIEDEVQARSTEIWEVDWKQTPAYIIDANRSKEEVILEAKKIIWSQL